MKVAAIELNRHGGSVNRLYPFIAVLLLPACATTSPHEFSQPTAQWQTRTGQLLYRNARTSVIGDVVVRFSQRGDFELSFSKGPGLTILVLRQDANFAEVKGAMAGRGWSGPLNQAPPQLRSWLELRDAIVGARNRHQVRHISGTETFVFRF